MSKITLGIIVLLSALLLTVSFVKLANQFTQTIIYINNPFSISVDLTVKCDWDNELNGFKFQKDFSIPSKQLTKVVLPDTYHECQIWPFNVSIFGE